jgi:hypothetical protein
MSVTIFMAAAEYDTTVHPDVGFGEWHEKTPKIGFFEMNLSNTNFAEMMLFLGETVDSSLTGTWGLVAIDRILATLFKAINSERPKQFEKATVTEGNFTSFGRDAAYVEQRLASLQQLLQAARVIGSTVHYG